MRAFSEHKGCTMQDWECGDEADKEHMETFVEEYGSDGCGFDGGGNTG